MGVFALSTANDRQDSSWLQDRLHFSSFPILLLLFHPDSCFSYPCLLHPTASPYCPSSLPFTLPPLSFISAFFCYLLGSTAYTYIHNQLTSCPVLFIHHLSMHIIYFHIHIYST